MHWKPVIYASCSLSDTEQGYSQIEKEALAIAWACVKFSMYVLGKAIHLETDHKPTPQQDQLLAFGLGCASLGLIYIISHVPENFLYTVDTFLCSSCLYLQHPWSGRSADRVLCKCPCFHLANKPRPSG